MDLRRLPDRFTVSLMLTTRMRSWTIASAVMAFIATCLPLSVARAESPEHARKGQNVQEELDRKEQERFQEKLRKAREADRVREAERARRARETEERQAQSAERAREALESAHAREAREAESLQAAREADRERSGRRRRGQADEHGNTPSR